MTTATITPAPVRKAVQVRATPARAFEVFTTGIARWWPATHKIGQAPLREAVLEPRAGGRWFERGRTAANAIGAACWSGSHPRASSSPGRSTRSGASTPTW
jgi:hypothetical protein